MFVLFTYSLHTLTCMLILISIVQEIITIIWRRPTSRSYFLTMRKISDRPIGWQGPFIYAQTMRNLCAYVRMRTGNISGQQGMGWPGGLVGLVGRAWLGWLRGFVWLRFCENASAFSHFLLLKPSQIFFLDTKLRTRPHDASAPVAYLTFFQM